MRSEESDLASKDLYLELLDIMGYVFQVVLEDGKTINCTIVQ